MRRALLIVTFAASAVSAQIPSITFRQPVTSQPINPRYVVSPADGTVYFSDHSNITDRFIGRVERDGTVTKFPYPCPGCAAGTEGLSFQSMTIGPDGNVWVPVLRARAADTSPLESAIVRLTPAGVYTVFPLSNPAAFASSGGFGHSAITKGPDGNLWFTQNNANRIARITPAGAITEFPLPNPDSNPVHLVAGPDGNIWFTELRGSRIGRITPAGAITEFPIQFTGTNLPRPHDITVGSDGNLWVTMEFGGPPGNNVTRVTTAGVMTTFAFPRFNLLPQHIVAAGDGNLYFTNLGATGELGRVNLTGSAKAPGIDADPFIEFDAANEIGNPRLFDLTIRYNFRPQLTIFGSALTGTPPSFTDLGFEAIIGPVSADRLATTKGNQNSSGEAIDPISTTTGELYETAEPDLVLRGPMPVIFQRYYASRISSDGATGSALGTNWLHNYDWRIRSISADGNRLGVLDWRGREHRFVRSGSSWMLEGPLDVPVQLVQTADGFVFGDPLTEMVRTFDTAGRLVKIEDTRGNAHTLSYVTNNLASVTDGLGRTLTFTYDAANRLTAVSDGTRTVRFSHSGDQLATVTDTLSNVTTYSYSGNGQLSSTRLPRGNVAYAQTFSNEGRVVTQTSGGANTTNVVYTTGQTSITDPAGGVVTHAYAAAGGELTRFTDQASRQVTLGYDSAGRRTSVVDRLGLTTSIAYDPASGKPSMVTLADGTLYSFTYTSRVFNGITLYPLARVTFPDGANESYTYDANGNLASLTDRLSRTWTFVHDSRGQLLTATNPAGGVLTNTFHPDGSLASTRDSDTGETRFAYDAFGRLVRTTRPDGAFTEVTWDADDRVTAVRNELGNVATAQYDANDNLIRATDPSGAASTFEFDSLDRLIRSTDRVGGVRMLSFDVRDLPASITDPNNLRTTLAFDSRRRLELITDPAGKASRLAYDDEAEVLSVTNPLNQTARRTVNALGLDASVIDPLGRTVSLERDQLNRVSAVREPLSRSTLFGRNAAGEVTAITRSGLGAMRLGYNNLGLLETLTDFRGNRWTQTFTSVGRIATTTDPLGRAVRYGYDTRGRPANVTFPDAGTLDVTRDAAGNVTRLNHSGGPDLRYRYDANNRLIEADRVVFTYDGEGRIVSANVDGFDVRATYDRGGRMTQLVYANSGSVSYSWDSRDNLIAVFDTFTNSQTTFTYDDANRLTGVNRPNGVNTVYTYNAAGQPVRIRHGNLLDLQYTYNDAGQILEETSSGTLDPAALPDSVFAARTFGYNAANEVSSPGFGYDQRGRRIAMPDFAAPAAKPEPIGADNDTIIRWDGADRLTGLNNTVFIWTGLDTLRTTDTGLSGGRTGFITGYAIAGWPSIVIADTGGNQAVFFFHPSSGDLLHGSFSAGQGGTNAAYPLSDGEGTIRAVTDRLGGVIARFERDPFGLPLAEETVHPLLARYRGVFGNLYSPESKTYIEGKTIFDPQTQARLSPSQTNLLGQEILIKGSYALYSDQLLSGSTITDGGGVGENDVYGYFADVDQPSQENIAEFGVLTETFDREYGRNQVASGNLFRTSGTNEFHGSAFFFHRRAGLNANDLFEEAGTGLTRLLGTPGRTTRSEHGGRIVRDRQFFFFDPARTVAGRLLHSEHTVIRGGYGVYYDRFPGFVNELKAISPVGIQFLKGDHASSTRSSVKFLGSRVDADSRRLSNGYQLESHYNLSNNLFGGAFQIQKRFSDRWSFAANGSLNGWTEHFDLRGER